MRVYVRATAGRPTSVTSDVIVVVVVVVETDSRSDRHPSPGGTVQARSPCIRVLCVMVLVNVARVGLEARARPETYGTNANASVRSLRSTRVACGV